MIKKLGTIISEGCAVGKIHFIKKSESLDTPVEIKVKDAALEISLFEKAKDVARGQLLDLYAEIQKKAGDYEASIFGVHIMMLDDPIFTSQVEEKVRENKLSARSAICEVREIYIEQIKENGDGYFDERIADILDVTDRIIENIGDVKSIDNTFVRDADDAKVCDTNNIIKGDFSDKIVYADNLLPSEAMRAINNGAAALVSNKGSKYSHIAILARTLSIPYICEVSLDDNANGKQACIMVENEDNKDFDMMAIIIDPDKETIEKCQNIISKNDGEAKEKFANLFAENGRIIAADGRKVDIYANVNNAGQVVDAIDAGADGIGIFRSEYLFLERDNYPSEDEQFEVYKSALEAAKGKPVIIRTLDVGSDKSEKYLQIDEEENPALGLRGIRFCFDREDVFRIQLRALFRASIYGDLRIMYPMIISVSEVIKIREISKSVRNELVLEGFRINDVKEGIMIETPAAALVSDELAKVSDFFSIGSNDLAQYTLAFDRGAAKPYEFFDPHHKAVLKLIKMTCDNAHEQGIRVGICGELGADIKMIPELISAGVDSLSMPRTKIVKIRNATNF